MGAVGTAATRPSRPVLIFDGECHFCRRWVSRWRQATGDEVEYIALQEESTAARFPEIPREELEKAVHFVQVDGQIFRGAEGVFRSLGTRKRFLLRLYQEVPFFARVSDGSYEFVAEHRSLFSRVTRLLWGEQVERANFIAVRWIFVRLMALIYFFAFTSLWIQIPGLYGKNGILPVTTIMEQLRESTPNLSGTGRFLAAPTLFWFDTNDWFLNGMCATGTGLAVIALLGFSPALCFAGLWLLYLSFCTVGQEFLGFQWDALLLEAGFLTVFLAPWRPWPEPNRERSPSPVVLWLFRWLLFRLMFWSGLAKLESGDPNWRNLTALKFHYETQPLPTWIGWHAHHLPDWFQKGSVAGMFAIQLFVPFFIFLPRRPRAFACWAFISLEMLIGLTGNYCFFNLLSISLCLLLLDDFTVLKWIPAKWRHYFVPQPKTVFAPSRGTTVAVLSVMHRAILGALVAVVLFVSSVYMAGMLRVQVGWPRALTRLYSVIAPFQSINTYGLFAIMTTSRLEIVIEGSNDRENWQAYEFKFKPGDLKRRPAFVEPHQPRLDWQMWFAALGSFRSNPWFLHFCERLLDGNSEVVQLLEHNAFPERPPKFLRARLYEYQFTSPEEKRATGNWWKREEKGLYLPVISKESFRKNDPP